jgi:hypothetical protein
VNKISKKYHYLPQNITTGKNVVLELQEGYYADWFHQLGANKHHHNVLEKNLLTNACIIFSLFGSRSFPLHARTTFWYRTNKNAQ